MCRAPTGCATTAVRVRSGPTVHTAQTAPIAACVAARCRRQLLQRHRHRRSQPHASATLWSCPPQTQPFFVISRIYSAYTGVRTVWSSQDVRYGSSRAVRASTFITLPRSPTGHSDPIIIGSTAALRASSRLHPALHMPRALTMSPRQCKKGRRPASGGTGAVRNGRAVGLASQRCAHRARRRRHYRRAHPASVQTHALRRARKRLVERLCIVMASATMEGRARRVTTVSMVPTVQTAA